MSRRPAYPVEVKSSPGVFWMTAGCAGFLVLLFVGIAFMAYLSGQFFEEVWLYVGTIGGSILFGVCCCAFVALTRTRLYSDRVERQGIFMSREMRRADVSSFSIRQDGQIRLVHRDDPKRGLTITQEVWLNQDWADWLNSLSDQNREEMVAQEAALEADARLGNSPAERRLVLLKLKRAAGAATVLAFAAAGWLIFYPQPYALALAMNGVIPLLALAAGWRWRGALSVAEDDSKTGLIGDVSTLWLMPSLAIALRALYDSALIDPIPPFFAGVVLTALPWAALLALSSSTRRWFMGAFSFVVLLGWGWGGLVLLNSELDRGTPTVAQGIVLSRDESGDGPATVTVKILRPAAEVIESVEVSDALDRQAQPQSLVCLNIYPGFFGWREAYAVKCEAK